jgi:hypothetical protein
MVSWLRTVPSALRWMKVDLRLEGFVDAVLRPRLRQRLQLDVGRVAPQFGVVSLDRAHLGQVEREQPRLLIASSAASFSPRIGVVETVRFLRQFTVGYGDYAEEREALVGRKSLDELLREIRERRGVTADVS